MADKGVSLEATDVFSLGGFFIAQNSDTSGAQEYDPLIKADGDFNDFSDVFNNITTVTVNYKFGAATGLGAAMPEAGAVSNGYLITEWTVNSVQNSRPSIDVTGHNHAVNAHIDDRNTYAASAAIKTLLTGALGAYDFAGLSGDEVCVLSSTYTLSLNHIDLECDQGDHWVGQNIQGIERCVVNFTGLNETFTIADWTVTGYQAAGDSNQEFDVSSISFERLVTRTP